VTVYLLAQRVLDVTSLTKLTVTVPLQLSVVVTAVGLGVGTPEEQVTVVAGGQVICGATLSLTVMICEQVAVLPQASVALYVRVTVYLLIHAVFEVTSLTKLILTLPAHASDAVTLWRF
jgi:hypothetical protein